MNYLDAFHYAIELAKKAGFRLHHVAGNSETCYYDHPGRPGVLLRLSTHRQGSRSVTQTNPAAGAAFSPRAVHVTRSSVEKIMITTIGRYFLFDPAPSEYKGKRGTW